MTPKTQIREGKLDMKRNRETSYDADEHTREMRLDQHNGKVAQSRPAEKKSGVMAQQASPPGCRSALVAVPPKTSTPPWYGYESTI